jgi:hypothetical protein
MPRTFLLLPEEKNPISRSKKQGIFLKNIGKNTCIPERDLV